VLKTRQITYLSTRLPGVDRGQEEQERRMRELDAELRVLDGEAERVEADRVRALGAVESAIWGIRRY
jgi:mediator of RNA polymerase II transcription subunit 21